MKQIKKILAVVLIFILATVIFVIPASADEINDYQKSVVFIGATVKYSASNYNLSFSGSSSGTGFAVGEPGEPVQYIATCAHVVRGLEGIYTAVVDLSTGALLSDPERQVDGTKYPSRRDVTQGGRKYAVICDYFTTETTDLYACFSNSSNDWTTLTTVNVNDDVDLALCKLASDPTTKIKALPLQLRKDVKINTDIISIGYPSTSMVFNKESRLDASDSTVKDGIISKLQRTNGIQNAKLTYDTYEVTAELITGMSGGPVISEESGAVVGVNAFIVADASQAAAARYAVCIDYLTSMLDYEGIEYEVYTGINILVIVLIALAVLIFAGGIVVLIILLTRKKSAPVSQVVTPVNNTPIEPVATKKYYLIGLEGPMSGRKIAITDAITIGRDPSRCNLVFSGNQPGVSGVHCEVRVKGDIITLTDCGSSFGTYIDGGVRMERGQSVVLHNDSKFYVGSDKISFKVKY